jgi:transcriptional regulator with XRE-family HTH domain
MRVGTRPGGGRYLAELRHAAGLDIETAASQSGIDPKRLAAIENDEVGILFLEAFDLARTYGLHLRQLHEGWLRATRRD